MLPPTLLADVLDACREAFDVASDAEITSEADPGTVDQAHFAALAAMGVNRLSMGVQSFDDAELAWLGRIHSAAEAETAFHAARRAGFANINLDFIFGLPGQGPAAWARTLARAISLAPEHLSLYSLTVEPACRLRSGARGAIAEPDDDLAADLYALACDTLAAGGYEQYEISNWARTDERRTTNYEHPASVLRPSSFVVITTSSTGAMSRTLGSAGAQLRGRSGDGGTSSRCRSTSGGLQTGGRRSVRVRSSTGGWRWARR